MRFFLQAIAVEMFNVASSILWCDTHEND